MMQQRNINKDFRVLFGDIFIVPFLCPALGYWTAQRAARGGEIWLHLTENDLPVGGEFDCKLLENVKSLPHALPPPPPPTLPGFTLIGAVDMCRVFFPAAFISNSGSLILGPQIFHQKRFFIFPPPFFFYIPPFFALPPSPLHFYCFPSTTTPIPSHILDLT